AARGPAARGGVAARDADGRAQRDLSGGDRSAGSPARQTDERMTRLVEVPAHFDDRSFDQFAGAFAEARRDDERLLFDAHAAEWASPYGLVGLLAAGQAARRPGSGAPAERPLLTAPTSPEVLSYWARAGSFREAAELFEIRGKVTRVEAAEQSEVLLPVTPVRAAEDVLAAALVQGVSRFRDPGRGQGLAGIRRYLVRWTGKIAIRSGTARIAIVPPWDDDVPLKDGLPPFPGAQVLIIIPEQGSAER